MSEDPEEEWTIRKWLHFVCNYLKRDGQDSVARGIEEFLKEMDKNGTEYTNKELAEALKQINLEIKSVYHYTYTKGVLDRIIKALEGEEWKPISIS